MDPLHTVNCAYYILQQLEKQRQITEVFHVKTDAEVFAVVKSSSKNPIHSNKKENKKGKMDRFCDHCKMGGHTVDQCFKIHGYPDWYKGEKHISGPRIVAQVSCDAAEGI